MIYLLLPAYDEQEALALLLPRIHQVLRRHQLAGQIVVVDDGSTDGTAETARAAGGHQVLAHPHNMGLAAALRTGLGYIASAAQSDDVIVVMDADNTHDPDLIPRMMQQIDGGFDVVIASRFRPGARVVGVPLVRQLLSNTGGWVFRLLVPIRGVRDFTCGYRAYRAGVIQRAVQRWGDRFITETGFAAMVDILLKLRLMDNVSMTELPFVLRYDLKPGASKMRVGSNIAASLRLALRRAAGKLD